MEKRIPFNTDYSIDEDGNVYSYKYGDRRLRKAWLDSKKRYYMIDLNKDNQTTKYLIHRLVGITFIPNPDNLPEIDHIDGNTHNNNVNNLRWCDRKFNMARCFEKFSPVRNYIVVEMLKNDQHVGYFKSILLAAKYAEKKFNTSESSLRKYKYSGGITLVQVDVTTIENIKIIESLDEVE